MVIFHSYVKLPVGICKYTKPNFRMVMTCGMVAGVDPHGMQSPEAAMERSPI
jgi:hypothetical protein